MLIDVHCHLDGIKDLEGVLQRAKNAGVGIIISNGINQKTNRITLDIAKKYPQVKAALGLYPTDALEMTDEEVEDELEFIKKQKDNIMAIGEVGLDYHWISDSLQQKRERVVFEKVISLAEKLKKPVIVHSRKAEKDVLELLGSSKLKKAVLHCFGGNLKLVEAAVDAGWWFSIPANINRDEHFRKIVEMIVSTKLLTETDAPYLSPEKNISNEPANVAKSLLVIAELKKITKEEMENIIFANYQKVFL